MKKARLGVFSQVDERSGVIDGGPVAVGVEESQTCAARFVVIRLEAAELAARPRCLNCSGGGVEAGFRRSHKNGWKRKSQIIIREHWRGRGSRDSTFIARHQDERHRQTQIRRVHEQPNREFFEKRKLTRYNGHLDPRYVRARHKTNCMRLNLDRGP